MELSKLDEIRFVCSVIGTIYLPNFASLSSSFLGSSPYFLPYSPKSAAQDVNPWQKGHGHPDDAFYYLR